jgi:N12 class adenine-specific DNA methylase/predicted RNA methylase
MNAKFVSAAASSAVPSNSADALIAAADQLLTDLARGVAIDARALRAAMIASFGASDAEGAWDWKAAYEACEAAQVLFLRKFGRAMRERAASPARFLAMLTKLAALLPSHTRRSEESQALQQFSTPIALGFVASSAAAITADDLVLEPSAGTGLLAIHTELAGAGLILNEIAGIRADLLDRLFPGAAVTRYDAAHIHDHLDLTVRPSVVLMNPPFSAAVHVDGRVADAALRHMSSALAHLANGGRLVAITGAGLSPDNPSWRADFVRLQECSRVVFSAAIDGAVYARHGSTGQTCLHVIDRIPADDPTAFPVSAGTAGDTATLLDWVARHVPPRAASRVSPAIARAPAPAAARHVPAVNFRITDEVELGKGSEGVKFADNLNAIRILKAIERENRRATPEEQRALARYVGWGGLANAFAGSNGEFKPGWEERGRELMDLLTSEELRAARASTRSAHYTSQPVIEAMWKAAQRLGFDGGLTLELSAGTGNFIGLVPESIAGRTRFIAIERDSLTSRMTKLLYPQETILNAGTQEVPVPDGEALLNIGNPPFGSESLLWQYKPEYKGASIHNQFFLAGVDALQPSGLHIAVVSRYLLDAQDPGVREQLAQKAKLIGAIRLPGTAFKENARTEVVTDIVILQRLTPSEQMAMEDAFNMRNDRHAAPEDRRDAQQKIPTWVETAEIPDPLGGEPMKVNRYFAENPHMVMGRHERSGTMRQHGELTVKLPEGSDLARLLDEAVGKLPSKIIDLNREAIDQSLERHRTMSESLEVAIAGHEPGHVELHEGKLRNVYERETPTGGIELARRVLTPETPWSPQLSMDDKGRWFTQEARTDDSGKKVKQGRGNVYDKKFYPGNKVPASLQLGDARYDRLREIVNLRDLLKRQLVLEANDAPPYEMESNRRRLADAYGRYSTKHGLLNDPKNNALLSQMPDGSLVQALEFGYRPGVTAARAAKTGGKSHAPTADRAPILSRRVVPKYQQPERANDPHDALQISLSEFGRVNIERIAGLLGTTPDDAARQLQEGDKALIYWDPALQIWDTRERYLTGNVREKLNAARAAAAENNDLDRNVKDLEAVQPAPWTADQVSPVIGSNWIKPGYYADFARHLVGGDPHVSYSEITNAFQYANHNPDPAKSPNWDVHREGNSPFEFDQIYQGMLNSRVPTVFKTETGPDGRDRRVRDQVATEQVRLKADEIEREFRDWIFQDTDRRNDLVKTFNDKFNTRVTRQHDGSHLRLPGKVPDTVITLRRHQKNAVWRTISERYALLDHVVGAGKTFTAIARIMERRRMGLSKKPMVVVPNHLVEQWAQDVYRLYPGAKVLAAGKNDFERKNRRRLFAKIATGDFDIIVVPHSSFGFIPISPETERRFLEEELRIAQQAVKEAEEAAAEAGLGGGRSKPFNVKEAERLVATIETRLAGLRSRKKDRIVSFEQMGVDDLTVDEAHEFKNLFYSSRMVNVRGMGDKHGSQKAFDLYNKVRVLRESPTGSVVFLTGTPISNSAVEMYTMMRYLAADDLKSLRIEHFDAWRSQSVSATSAWEPTEAGGLKEVTRLGREWSNMRALMELYYSFTDAVPQEDITKWYAEDNGGKPFPVPRVKGGKDRMEVVVQPTPAQSRILAGVIAGFNRLPNIKDPYERNAERLRLMDRARKVSLDARAVDPSLATAVNDNFKSGEEGGKLDRVADEVARIHKEWNGDKGTQLIFLDRGVAASKQDLTVIKEYDKWVQKRDEAEKGSDEAGYRRAVEELDKFDPNEIAELRRAQQGGWNAYDQLRQNLITRGIPDSEIRYVQEANSDAEKKAIFDDVNDGLVRILIGSTPKMGAGTNVQKRLVALHHVDVTWKPSDIEQREGRIIRQGNALLDKYGHDRFEVEVLAYVTERTVDAKMWSLNSTKLKMINGIRKYTGAFNMEFEDEEAIGMAEIAALASGDPLLQERVKLEGEISKLDLQERGHKRKVWALQDEINWAERAIRNNPERIATINAAAIEARAALNEVAQKARARSVTIEGERHTTARDALEAARQAIDLQQRGDEHARYSINIDGRQYTNKAGIEDAVYNALGDQAPFEATVDGETITRRSKLANIVARRVVEVIKSRQDRVIPLGRMLGCDFKISTEAEGNRSRRDEITVELILDRGNRTFASTYWTYLRTDFPPQSARALIDKLLEEVVDRSRSSCSRLQHEMEEAEAKLPTLKEQLGKPFAQAGELARKRERLKEVIRILAEATKAAEAAASTGAQASGPPTIADGGALAASTDEPANVGVLMARHPPVRITEQSSQ